MKIVADTENRLVIQTNAIFAIVFLIVFAALLLVAFWGELLAYLGVAALLVACLFIPYKQEIVADKQANTLSVNSSSLLRSSSRSTPISSVSQLVITVQTSRSMQSSRRGSQTRTSVSFYAQLNEEAKGVIEFMLPAPGVSSTSVAGISLNQSIKHYDVLERLAEVIGVPLRKQAPMNPMDAITSFTGRMQD